jgi:hypothetical protein
MKLHFHGKTYEGPHLQWNVTEGQVGGLYRGSPWKVHHLKEQHRSSHKPFLLTYRGVHYTKG